ncbi:hypothetical protein BSLG_004031 [Batrachochytrium salamandrivorans]|nr:hypothetical protein BSLG_004031 [Batrachochytrium salamandrivorans]
MPPPYPPMFYGQHPPPMGHHPMTHPPHPMMARPMMMMGGAHMPSPIPPQMPPFGMHQQQMSAYPMGLPPQPGMRGPPVPPHMMRPPMPSSAMPPGLPPVPNLLQPSQHQIQHQIQHPVQHPHLLQHQPLPLNSSSPANSNPLPIATSAISTTVPSVTSGRGSLAHINSSVSATAFQELLTTVFIGKIEIQYLMLLCYSCSALSGNGSLRSASEIHSNIGAEASVVDTDMDRDITTPAEKEDTDMDADHSTNGKDTGKVKAPIARLGMSNPLIVTVDEITKAHLRTIKLDPDVEGEETDKERTLKAIQEVLDDIPSSQTHDFMERLDELVPLTESAKQRESSAAESSRQGVSQQEEAEAVIIDRRRERREQDRNVLFQERQRRWESSEAERVNFFTKRLAEFNDDVEHEKYDEEFYRDRARWLSRRSRERQREIDADDRDRAVEETERVFATAHESESAARVKAKAESGDVVSRIMTKEERIVAIQSLSQYTCRSRGLGNGRSNGISWMRPFLKRKIVEFLGDEENDLTEFILDKIKKQVNAQIVLDELKMVLDDEAEVFVMKLWRMVIYETEARGQGL